MKNNIETMIKKQKTTKKNNMQMYTLLHNLDDDIGFQEQLSFPESL